MNRRLPPNNLRDRKFFVLEVRPGTRQVVLHIDDQTSYDLGSYWRSEQQRVGSIGAVVYLRTALGNESLIRESMSAAFTYGKAIVNVDRCTVRPMIQKGLSVDEIESKKLFAGVEERDEETRFAYVEKDVHPIIPTRRKVTQ